MEITKKLFPDRFLILPNNKYFFGDKKDQGNPFKIFCSFHCQDIAEIQDLAVIQQELLAIMQRPDLQKIE